MIKTAPHTKRYFLITLVFAYTCIIQAESISLSEQFSIFKLDQIISQPTNFHPVPTASDDFWRDYLPQNIRDEYISQGLHYKRESNWNNIPPSLFSEYRRNGNRNRYEQQNYVKRRQFACLVMAEIMEGKKKFVEDILKGLDYFMS